MRLQFISANSRQLTKVRATSTWRRRQWHPTPVLLPGKFHGRRSLEGCSPWGRWGLDTTERLHFHFSLSCIGEGNGTPLQCSCLENPRDGGAWWAAVYGVAQSRIRLKWLSSILPLHGSLQGLNLETVPAYRLAGTVESRILERMISGLYGNCTHVLFTVNSFLKCFCINGLYLKSDFTQ